MLHELGDFQPAQFADDDAFRPADARQIVPQQIDDHHVFGGVLFALPEFVASEQIGLWTGSPAARAFDRSGFDLSSDDLQEPFGRSDENLEFAEVEIAGKRGRVSPPEPLVERDRIIGRRIQQPLGEIHLKDIPGANVFDSAARFQGIPQAKNC